MLAALASALAARDPYTAAQAAHVTFPLAGRLAAWLDWEEQPGAADDASPRRD